MEKTIGIVLVAALAASVAALASQVPCARMKDEVILRVSKPARMSIDDASLYPLQPCLPRGLRSALLKAACYEIGSSARTISSPHVVRMPRPHRSVRVQDWWLDLPLKWK